MLHSGCSVLDELNSDQKKWHYDMSNITQDI